ncbi:phosphoenolpyruvate synthase, partial [Candidatus Uhrbacteria bacterium]|nr:phosphoenolpyruvate synthase [Candidatus Uhrbacteria bacterium]MBD3283904.1 phosphoenolpyruvate synthase [Candidatus Uhrbacteria bacterium]
MLSRIRFFKDIDMHDVASVGGKNASLGEMYRNLTKQGVRIPDGFATTAEAFREFLAENELRNIIRDTLKGINLKKYSDVKQRGSKIRSAILKGQLPTAFKEEIRVAYRELNRREGRGKPVDTAVRSSATAEDLPGASFAGQQETYLNIKGEAALLEAVRKCFASLYTDRAIVYREEKGFDHLAVALSVGVQKMVRSDKHSAGVLFTIDTESGFKDVVLINAAWGLGESVVQGKVDPDQYYVFKPLLEKSGTDPVISRRVGSKSSKIIYGTSAKSPVKTVPVKPLDQKRFCLTDEEMIQLARWGVQIEQYYSKLAEEDRPMDIEWAKDGVNGKLYIVQARPETVQSEMDREVLTTMKLKQKGKVLASGLAIGSRIGQGNVRVIKDVKSLKTFHDGDVLVTHMTDPDWVPIMKRASAIITDSGGRTCHAAIVARELGTPAIVGTKNASKTLKHGHAVTVSCAEGDVGWVYEGILPYEKQTVSFANLGTPKTDVMMNVAQPDLAFGYSAIPNKGVGLARTEFIFTDFIKIHPLALIHEKAIKDKRLLKQIADITYPYKDKKQFFIDKLAEGIAMIAAAFHPHDVIVRTSDFKTNEYASLIGGQLFEPEESNPMIGWRGASRYYDEKFVEAFKLECAAIRNVREAMGLENVVVMVPFCRTPQEGERVLQVMREAGLVRGRKGLRIFVMIEIPSNIIQAEKFADLFDGFSIGSNDLTQLTLGVDRDSELVSHIYNELDHAVLDSIRHVIKVAKKKRVKIGICGQAPSDYPEFARFLVREGID